MNRFFMINMHSACIQIIFFFIRKKELQLEDVKLVEQVFSDWYQLYL